MSSAFVATTTQVVSPSLALVMLSTSLDPPAPIAQLAVLSVSLMLQVMLPMPAPIAESDMRRVSLKASDVLLSVASIVMLSSAWSTSTSSVAVVSL